VLPGTTPAGPGGRSGNSARRGPKRTPNRSRDPPRSAQKAPKTTKKRPKPRSEKSVEKSVQKPKRISSLFDGRAKSGPFFGFPGRPGEIRGAKKSQNGEKAVQKKRVFFFSGDLFSGPCFG
jgi:hypothetical protein